MFLLTLKLIIFIASVCYFGWQFLRRVMKQNEQYLLVPFSLGFGIISYTFFVNVISYAIDVRTSFWLVLLLMVIAGIAMNRLAVKELILGVEKSTFKRLIITTAVFGLVFTSIILNNYAYDEEWHGGVIATIANGNFPVMATYIPDLFVQYHYGFDLAAASLMSFVGLPLPQASDVMMILMFLPIFWITFVVIKKISKSTTAAWLSAWLLFFGGGFRYLSVYEMIDWSKGKYIWDYVGQILSAFINNVPMSPGLFHSYSVDNFGVNMYHRPTLFATLILLFILWLIYLEAKSNKLYHQILLGLVLGFFALSAESWFAPTACAWGIWKLYLALRDKSVRKKLILGIVTVALTSSLTAIFQGGVITDAFLHANKGTAETSMSSFVIRPTPGLISYGTIYPFNEIKSWAFLIIEWGLPLLLFPFVLFYFRKKQNKFYDLFAIGVLFTMFIVFFIDYPVSSRDFARVNIFIFYLLGISLGIYLSSFYDKRKKMIWALLLIMSISPLFYNLRVIPLKWSFKQIIGQSEVDDSEILIAQEVKELLEDDGAVLTAIPYVVSQAWGRQVYWGNPEEDVVFNRDIENSLPWLLENKSLSEIKERGVDYVYLNEEFKKYDSFGFIEKNKNMLEEIYNKDNKYILYKIKL